MKRLLTVLLAGLLVAAFVLPAAAWEFSMTGEFEHRVRYIGRTGDTDLFGVAPLQDSVGGFAQAIPNPAAPAPALNNSVGVGFAGPNWYNRNVFVDDTGNVTTVGARVTEDPNIVGRGTAAAPIPINSIVFRRTSTITGRFADTGGARIVRGGFSTYGSDALYNDSRLTLRPNIRVNPAIRVFGVYTIGGMRHKYFQNYIGGFGMGIGTPPLERYFVHNTSMNAYDTAAIGSWEQFRVTVQLPIGIWSYGVKDFPFGVGASLAYNTRAEAFLTVLPYGPFRILHGIWPAHGGSRNSWNTVPDGDTKNDVFQGMLATYDCGVMQIGVGTIYRLYHANQGEVGPPAARPFAVGADTVDLTYIIYTKYNNGRFFAAAEYFWVDVDTTYLGDIPLYQEGYHFFAEIGGVAGPAKLRLMYALSSGAVLNNNNPTKQYIPLAINYQAMTPYQFLMFEQYAGGNNQFREVHGQMGDGYCFAGRVDYAVASNLNVWGSYIWAHRLERAGAFKGGVLSNGEAASAAQRAAFVTANFGPVANINPYVDDGYLGWEANIGIDWKLLENFNMHVQYAYWSPGEWFDQAYQAVGMRGGAKVIDAYVTGRDAIQAINGSLVVNF